MEQGSFKTIDEYIERFPAHVQERMRKLRALINDIAPGVVEVISYQMPTFKLNGKNLVHFAGYEHHIGFYPTPSAIEAFQDRLKKYKSSKGAVQFPLDEELPYELVREMVEYRVKEARG